MTLEEEFFPLIDVCTGRLMEVPEESEGEPIDIDHVLDLTDLLRQCVITDQPMKPLCQSDCQGLCQECGVNLNQEKCTCSDDRRDPRWAALSTLLHESKG